MAVSGDSANTRYRAEQRALEENEDGGQSGREFLARNPRALKHRRSPLKRRLLGLFSARVILTPVAYMV